MPKPIVRVIDLIPGTVRALAEVDVGTVSQAAFWNEFVCKHKPVIVRGAAAHWPALSRWRDSGYLEPRSSDVQVPCLRTFNHIPQFNELPGGDLGVGSLADRLRDIRAASDDDTFSIPTVPVPPGWRDDLGAYPFLAAERDRPPRSYRSRRLFIYRNAATEWHHHLTDETLTTQLVGSKRVSLFKLGEDNWRLYHQRIRANLHHLDLGEQGWQSSGAPLIKYEGLLAPGDALYLPPYWWHGIEPADHDLGITLAHCFRTPLRRLASWSEPMFREWMRTFLQRGQLRALTRSAALLVASTAARSQAGEPWDHGSHKGTRDDG